MLDCFLNYSVNPNLRFHSRIDKIIDDVAAYIAKENPGVKGFNRRGLYRMKQFYETYNGDEFVTPLVTQICS